MLTVSEKFAEVCPAPILYLHRHLDGYISFATERDNDDFRPLVSIRAGELETWFPAFREQLLKDGYVGINADWRLRSYGEHGSSYGYPLHRSDKLSYINACYVDIDFHTLGLDIGTVIGRIVNLQESGQLPHASMFVRSGHGLWALWLVHDIENEDLSQRAFPDKLELYSRIQAAIIERLLPLGADMACRDAARHLRIAGSLNTGSESTVEWLIQGKGACGYIYTLPQLARLFRAVPTRRHHGEIVAHNPAKRRGWVALNAQRLRDFNTLRALRGGFSEGCRHNAMKIYGWLLRCNAIPNADVLSLLTVMGEQCRPSLKKADIKDAWKYRQIRRMRDETISNWLLVTEGESELLERLPPAGLTAPKPVRVSIATIRQHVAERRATLRELVAAGSTFPEIRELAGRLAGRGIRACPATVLKDLRAIGLQSNRTRDARADAADLQLPLAVLIEVSA